MALPSTRSATGTLDEYPSMECASTKSVGGSSPASARRSSIVTPLHAVFSFDHFVTQWMSRVILVCGKAWNSAQDQRFAGRGPTFSVNDQSSSDTRGVGPADRTGKPSVSDWPGGMRSANSGAGRRPVKPLVAMIQLSLGCRRRFTCRGLVSDRQLPVGPDEMAGVAVRNAFEVVLMLGLGLPE